MPLGLNTQPGSRSELEILFQYLFISSKLTVSSYATEQATCSTGMPAAELGH